MLLATLLMLHTSAPLPHMPVDYDPIAAAAKDLKAQVEDDNGGGDLMLLSMATQDCKTMVRGAPAREWVIDWKTIKTLGLQQNFIFVKGDDLQIAIVADTSKADQADKLSELAMAMTNAKRGCQGEYD